MLLFVFFVASSKLRMMERSPRITASLTSIAAGGAKYEGPFCQDSWTSGLIGQASKVFYLDSNNRVRDCRSSYRSCRRDRI